MNRDIAIIGMAGRFPDARNLEQLYQNLRLGQDSLRTISAERLRSTTLPPDRQYHVRGYLEGVDCFDHALFNISLAEARVMDPHQRLLLEVAYETFENAGYSLDAVDGSNTGVYVADCQLPYDALIDEATPTTLTGNTSEFLATRLNRFFNLTGGVALFDTSCSSSLVALHHACNELILGDVAQALVCAANLELFPFKDAGLDPGVASPDGTSKPFSEQANGMTYGEAVACVLLKPLPQALADGNLIHAIIKSTSVNNNARRSASLTAPDSLAQAEVIRRAWGKAGVPLRQVQYIEAHGSGTQLGDILEVGGLNLAFGAEDAGKRVCQISTIKANIGHARAAAGIAGLIKAVLSLKKKVLFPTVHAGQPNPHADFDAAVYLEGACRDWETPGGAVRYCGVSSIGFSGTNCHVALQEAPGGAPSADAGANGAAPYLFPVSAHSPEALVRNVRALLGRTDSLTDADLPRVQYVLTAGRQHYRYRCAVTAGSRDALRAELDGVLHGAPSTPAGPVEKLFFVFADAGAVTEADLARYAGECPAFAAACAECRPWLDGSAPPLVTGFVFQYCYYKLLEAHGLVTGHVVAVGSGKILAEVVTGALPLRDGLARVRLFGQKPDPGLTDRLHALLGREMAGGRVLFAEMGCATSLSPLLAGHPECGRGFGLLRPAGGSPRQGLLRLFGDLYTLGYPVDWDAYCRPTPAQRIELPAYQFLPTRCWTRETPPARFLPDAAEAPAPAPAVTEPDCTDTELLLAGFWREALGKDTFSRYDDFFEVGGDSLKATRVINRVRDYFDLDVHFEDVFDYPTLEALAAYLDQVSSTEQKVALIWREVLQRESVDKDDDFFEMGAHSLIANQVLNRIRRTLGVGLNFEDIFRYPTVRKLAGHLDRAAAPGHAPAAEVRLAPLPPAAHYALSFGQKRLWVMSRFAEASVAYNTPVAFTVTGPLDQAAFRQAFETLVERHEALRTVFLLTEEGPRQKVLAPGESRFRVDYADLRSRGEAAAAALLLEGAQRPFDFEAGPLLRVQLAQLDEEKHLFLLVIHHIISDGWSFGVVFREIAALYNAFRAGRPNPLPPLPVQYKDYAHWQNELLSGDRLAAHQAYWQGQFADGLPVLELPLSFPRPREKTYNGGRVEVVLDASVRDGLYGLNRQYGSSLFMTLLASLKTFLYRYSGQEDLVIGYPVAGRESLELERQIGFYANTLPIRTRFSGAEGFDRLLGEVRQNILGARQHHEYPFDRMVDDLQAPRDASRSPLFDVVLVLENAETETAAGATTLDGLAVEGYSLGRNPGLVDLRVIFFESCSDITLAFEYNQDLFSRDLMAQMLAHYRQIIHAVIRDSRMPLYRLPYLSAAQEHRLVSAFNDTAVAVDDTLTMHGLFERQVQRTPEATALIDEGNVLTYGQLNQAANRLAHHLRDHFGVNNQAVVGLLTGRSANMVVAILAILKAGGAYLPIDPDYPAGRKEYMLADAGVELLLIDSAYLFDVSNFAGSLFALDIQLDALDTPAANPEPAGSASDLAYLIYTSGSTGLPKGVMVEHRSNVNMALSQVRTFGITASDRVLQFASVGFDASVSEICMALYAGAALVLVQPQQITDAKVFADFLRARAVTVATLPPRYLQVFDPEELGTIRVLITAGEAALPLRGDRKDLAYFNAYGPTECAVCVSIHRVEAPAAGRERIPIGKPIANTEVYVLDRQGQLVPVGVTGELYVGGRGLARGYWGQPELTAQKFIAHPFREGQRLYRTGDLARWNEQGELEYLGRMDNQVKLRGFRIELSEIESVLLGCEGVQQAVVLLESGGGQLVAYLTGEAAGLDAGRLREQLGRQLPDYMVPVHYHPLGALPLTANGKIDRKALSLLEVALPQQAYQPPATEAEALLAQVWQQVLAKEVGRQADFFVSGGDSIKAIQIASRLYKQGYKLDLKDIFQSPCLHEQALKLAPLQQLLDQGPVTGSLPLTPIQQEYFALPDRGAPAFNQGLLLKGSHGLDEPAAKAICACLLAHHDALRLCFPPAAPGAALEAGYTAEVAGGGLVQQYNQGADLPLSLLTFPLGHLPLNQALAERDGHLFSLRSTALVETGPLLQAALFELPQGTQLALVIHHLAADAVSWRILREDLNCLYEKFVAGQRLALPPKTHSYQHWARQLVAQANSPFLQREKAYWQQLEDKARNLLPLPTEPLSAAPSSAVAQAGFRLEASFTQRLEEANAAFGTDSGELLLTALLLTLEEHFGRQQWLVQLEGHGRQGFSQGPAGEVNLSRTVGWFTCLYPVVVEVDAQQELSRPLKQVKEQVRSVPDKGLGYGLLRYLSGPEQREGLAFDLRPQVGFNYLGEFNQPEQQAAAGQSAAGLHPVEDSGGEETLPALPEGCFLAVSGAVTGGALRVQLRYRPADYSPATLEQLGRACRHKLEALIDHCTTRQERELTPSDFGYAKLSIEELENFFD